MNHRSTLQATLGALVGLLVAAVLVLASQVDDGTEGHDAVAPTSGASSGADSSEDFDPTCDHAVVVHAQQMEGDGADWELEVTPRSCAPHAQLRRTTLLALCDAVAALVADQPSATVDDPLTAACAALSSAGPSPSSAEATP